ncbi:MAG: ComF family protein [Acidimicrobiales bacterium]|nr:ComF family protein [Hyphomonadaceae bacterium]RZV40766.1 MAG: ComF family protein [Acidimicrobiales bacterium]
MLGKQLELWTVAQNLVRVVLPNHSLLTGKPEQTESVTLWETLEFLDAPCCDACGFPFEFDVGENVLCGRCEGKRPAFDRARSAIRYTEQSRKLVLDFKHGGRTDGLEFFAAQMHRAGRDLLHDAHILMPVPLHKKRLRQRKFNQAALLARALSKLSGLPYETNTILRAKNTPTQGGQSYLGRKRNVSGAFVIPEDKRKLIGNARIVLIDDVQTTGSTLEACAKVLKKYGAQQVDSLSLMRVVRPEPV